MSDIEKNLQRQCAAVLNSIHRGEKVTNTAQLKKAIEQYNKSIVEGGE